LQNAQVIYVYLEPLPLPESSSRSESELSFCSPNSSEIRSQELNKKNEERQIPNIKNILFITQNTLTRQSYQFYFHFIAAANPNSRKNVYFRMMKQAK